MTPLSATTLTTVELKDDSLIAVVHRLLKVWRGDRQLMILYDDTYDDTANCQQYDDVCWPS
jgi:hypothetical protein